MAANSPELNVVTGAFSYTGKYIARRLLANGIRVRSLTGHPNRHNTFDGQVSTAPFNFDRPAELAGSLEGATTLYNTYWVRFEHGRVTFEQAVENTQRLIEAAEQAGVRRMVHVSISNASEDSPLPYFRGKGILEKAIARSKLSYAILRPTVVFGKEDILINNIAWLLRHAPMFGVPGAGDYQLQPIYVEDLAEIAVSTGQGSDNVVMDVVGPEIYTFDELVRRIARTLRSRARIMYVNPELALSLSRLVGVSVGDVVLTRDEVGGLMANLLISEDPPLGKTRLSDWLAENADTLGMRYASELSRHYR